MSFKLIKEMMGSEFTFDMSAMGNNKEQSNPAAGIFSKNTEDRPDIISMDIPTLLRVMEWAHEDAKDDVMLHQFVNALIQVSFSHDHPLNMDDYVSVVAAVNNSSSQNHQESEEDVEIVFNN